MEWTHGVKGEQQAWTSLVALYKRKVGLIKTPLYNTDVWVWRWATCRRADWESGTPRTGFVEVALQGVHSRSMPIKPGYSNTHSVDTRSMPSNIIFL